MYTWRQPESRSTKLVSMRRGNKHRILSWTIGQPGRVLRATSSPVESTGEEFCDARMQTKAWQGGKLFRGGYHLPWSDVDIFWFIAKGKIIKQLHNLLICEDKRH